MHAAKASSRHEGDERRNRQHIGDESRSARPIKSEDIARETWAMRHGAAFLTPGYVVVPELSSQGGSSATDYIESKSKTGKSVSFTKTFDHPELEEMAQRTLAQSRYLIYANTARFLPGTYFVGINEFDMLDRMLDESRHAAGLCNKMAKSLKSERVTIVDLYKFKIDVDDRRVAVRVGASIYERLKVLRESYTGNNRRAYQIAMQLCNNADKLVAGAQREIIRFALASADSQRPLMIAHYGGRKGVGEVLREFKGKLPDFDYGPIDTAIDVFAPGRAARGE